MSLDERRASKDVARFPRVPGHMRTVIPLTRCSMCREGEVSDYAASTFMAYNGEPTCLEHAKLLQRLQKQQGEALGAMEHLNRKYGEG